MSQLKAYSFCALYLTADNFSRSIVEDTTSTAVLPRAARLAWFIDSADEAAKRWYMQDVLLRLHLAAGYTS